MGAAPVGIPAIEPRRSVPGSGSVRSNAGNGPVACAFGGRLGSTTVGLWTTSPSRSQCPHNVSRSRRRYSRSVPDPAMFGPVPAHAMPRVPLAKRSRGCHEVGGVDARPLGDDVWV